MKTSCLQQAVLSCCAILACSNALFAAETNPVAGAYPICWRDGPQVDMASLLGRNDVVYLSPACYEHEAMPVGNGRLCAMLWNANGLNLQINHADNVWHQSSSGRIRLTADVDLLEGAEHFQQRLSLDDGAIRTEYRGKAGQWSTVVTVFEGRDVAAIHFEGQVRGKLRLELEQWRPTAKRAAGAIGFVEDLPVEKATQFSRRQALLAAVDCPAEAGESVTRDGSTFIPIALNPPPAADGRISFTVYVANAFTSLDGDPASTAAESLAAARRDGWEKNSRNTADAWKQYWQRSFIHLTSADGVADYMENLWFLHLYWMNCAGRGEFPVKFNGGPFLMHRDSRSWGSPYWYQNTRELYWPLLAANHVELCSPLANLYRSVLPVEMEMTKRAFKVDGAQVEETMRIDGTGDKEQNSYTCLYLTTGIELSLQLYRQYLYTRDEEFFQAAVWPMLRETSRFYLNWVRKGDDGLYHIYPTSAKETFWRVQDAITDLAAMRRMFPIVIETSQRLGVEPELAERCKDVLASLPPYPRNPESDAWVACTFLQDPPTTGNEMLERLYVPRYSSHSAKENMNFENVECELIFPWELVGIGSDEAELATARKTYQVRRWKPANSWDQGAVWAARLGNPKDAAQDIIDHATSSQPWPQGFWNSVAGFCVADTLVDCPYFDSSGVNATTTNEMLLQSWDGRIRVWPATPQAWSGAFRLRSQTGFMVTSEKHGEEIAYVAIESLFGDPCRMVRPWQGDWSVSCDGQEIAKGDGVEVVFPTERGKTYVVTRSTMPMAVMPFAPMTPAVNEGVKPLRRTDAGNVSPQIGQPMLGITADGLTPVRLQIRKLRDDAQASIRQIVGDRTPLAIFAATWTNRSGVVRDAPWLIDRVYGPERIAPEHLGPYPTDPATSYTLQLAKPGTVHAIVWSFDRRAIRCDAPIGRLKTIVVDVSSDGVTWKPAVKEPWNNRRAGQAAPLDAAEASHVRITFCDDQGAALHVPVDEIELY